jgi:hypothetical protein
MRVGDENLIVLRANVANKRMGVLRIDRSRKLGRQTARKSCFSQLAFPIVTFEKLGEMWGFQQTPDPGHQVQETQAQQLAWQQYYSQQQVSQTQASFKQYLLPSSLYFN